MKHKLVCEVYCRNMLQTCLFKYDSISIRICYITQFFPNCYSLITPKHCSFFLTFLSSFARPFPRNSIRSYPNYNLCLFSRTPLFSAFRRECVCMYIYIYVYMCVLSFSILSPNYMFFHKSNRTYSMDRCNDIALSTNTRNEKYENCKY